MSGCTGLVEAPERRVDAGHRTADPVPSDQSTRPIFESISRQFGWQASVGHEIPSGCSLQAERFCSSRIYSRIERPPSLSTTAQRSHQKNRLCRLFSKGGISCLFNGQHCYRNFAGRRFTKVAPFVWKLRNLNTQGQ